MAARRSDNLAPERRVRRTRCSRVRTIALSAGAAAIALTASFIVAAPATAATSLVVDSLAFGVADSVPGDGVCLTAAGTCTLRAALEESNALNAPTGEVTVTVADGLVGNITPTAAGWMTSERTSDLDVGAYFAVTAPVEIDLDNRVTVTYSGDAYSATAFYLNGPDIVLRNASQIVSSESSFVVGPLADGVTLQGGSTSSTSSYASERFMLIREGASNVTVRDYRLKGFWDDLTVGGLFVINARSPYTPIRNVEIDGVHIDNTTTSTTCNASSGAGCVANITTIYPNNANAVVDGFSFHDSTVDGLSTQRAFSFANPQISSIDISNNSFINVRGTSDAFITLPNRVLGGTNLIEGNTFVRATTGTTRAIAWDGQQAAAAAGELRIADNFFDGFTAVSIDLTRTGDVAVEQNTFGSRSASRAQPGTAEETSDGQVMLDNRGTNANGGVATWYPTGAAVQNGQPATGLVNAVSPLATGTASCLATVTVQRPTTGVLPSSPTNVDVYWTADDTADVYLGRAQVTAPTASLSVSLPTAAQLQPTTTLGSTQQVSIVDAATGQAGGYLRVQTVADDGRSSQYSRMVALSGSCAPALELSHGSAQNDPTRQRNVHFVLSSSVALDPASVTADDISVSATATAATTDAARINPRVVSVTAIASSLGREYDVIVAVDDSADVTVAVAADTVVSAGGLANPDAATSDDPTVTFINPVILETPRISVVMGEPAGRTYALSLHPGAPVPAAQMTLELSVDQAGIDHGVSYSPASPRIGDASMVTDEITVTAAAGDVAAGTPAVISHTLVSDDPNYAGLVVPPLTVRLFATDPALQITKTVYLDVADSSTPDQVIATGTLAPSGGRLADGQTVCFVYTVSNVSRDDWATSLTDVVVTDTDERLGVDGVIGTVASLPIGESALLSSCGSLVPVDTSADSVTP